MVYDQAADFVDNRLKDKSLEGTKQLVEHGATFGTGSINPVLGAMAGILMNFFGSNDIKVTGTQSKLWSEAAEQLGSHFQAERIKPDGTTESYQAGPARFAAQERDFTNNSDLINRRTPTLG